MVRAILIGPFEGVVSYAVVPDTWADIIRKFEMNKFGPSNDKLDFLRVSLVGGTLASPMSFLLIGELLRQV